MCVNCQCKEIIQISCKSVPRALYKYDRMCEIYFSFEKTRKYNSWYYVSHICLLLHGISVWLLHSCILWFLQYRSVSPIVHRESQ